MLKKLILDCFKGCRFAEHDFNGLVTSMCGKNGTGKTTVPDAWYWLWTDKDYDLQSNPEVHPDFMAESEPSVTAVMEISGKQMVFHKFQSDMRTKKQKEQGAPVRVANKYEVNSVPKTQKDFVKSAEECGIDIDKFLMLSHTEVLLGMKIADRRNIVFALGGDVTDIDVADIIPECKDARELLAQYKPDEIIAMQKATIKRCKEQVESIPNQIIGMERAKIPVDPTLPARKEQLEKQISEKTAERDSYIEKSVTDKFDVQIRALQNSRTELYNKANTERLAKLGEAQFKESKAREALDGAKRTLNSLIQSGQTINDGFRSQIQIRTQLQAKLDAFKSAEFKATDVCPTCGQAIPEEQIESARAKWQKQVDESIKDLEDKLRAANTMIDSYRTDGGQLAEKKKNAEQSVKDCEGLLSDAQFEVAKYSDSITPDYSEIDAQIAEVQAQRAQVAENARKANEVGIEINALKTELANVIRRITQESNNERIDDDIEALRTSLDQYVQNKADAENILYQMQLISQRKNELLSDTVNSHFTKVKWRLFDIQKNGEIKDDCTPLVLCADGKYRDMTYSANTAAIQAAKLDICRGLQKFYGQELPIFLDSAECFDDFNRQSLAVMDTQLILLCVSEDEGLVLK